jgi:hypothetical protein
LGYLYKGGTKPGFWVLDLKFDLIFLIRKKKWKSKVYESKNLGSKLDPKVPWSF